MTKTPIPLPLLIVVATALLLAACAAAEPDQASTTTTPSVPTTTTEATTTDSGPAPSDAFTTEDHLDWLLDILARAEPPTEPEIERHFTDSFLATVPAAMIIESFGPIAGSFEVVEDDGGAVERSGLIVRDDGLRLAFSMAVDPDDGGRMIGLRLQPAAAEIDGPINPDTVDAAIAAVAPTSAYGIFDVTDGGCEAVHEFGVDQPLAVASSFKLWVLAAVAEAVAAGDLAWTDEVTVTAELRSTPDGEVQRLADGDGITVAELAVHMISISDNTATDLLLDHVGRERVEGAMVRAGVAEPERNIPMPSTREIFLLKLDPAHAGYLDRSVDERRTYLDETLAGRPLSGPGGIDEAELPTAPWQIEELEWFATPTDLCRAMLRLVELADDPVNQPYLDDALAANAGAPIDDSRWSTVWFKGGSEPGVTAMTWYLVDTAGGAFVAAGAINDPGEDFGEVAGVGALQTLIPLVESR